jgi:hypothetical protein
MRKTNLNDVTRLAKRTFTGSGHVTSAHHFGVSTPAELTARGKGAVRALVRHLQLQVEYAPAHANHAMRELNLSLPQCISALSHMEAMAPDLPVYPLDRDYLHFLPKTRTDELDLMVFDWSTNLWRPARFETMHMNSANILAPNIVVTTPHDKLELSHDLRSPAIVRKDEYDVLTDFKHLTFSVEWVGAGISPQNDSYIVHSFMPVYR